MASEFQIAKNKEINKTTTAPKRSASMGAQVIPIM